MSAAKMPERKSTTKKKPYTKPQIVYKQPLEAKAAACAFTSVGTGKATTGGPPPPYGNCGYHFLFS